MAKKKLTVEIAGDVKGLAGAVDDADKKVGGLGGSFDKLAKAAAGAFALKEVGGFLMDSAKAAADDEKAQVSLAKTLENVAGATKAQVGEVEKWINKTQNATGVLDDDLRPAFDTLLRGTKDVTKAQNLLGLAMDISAGTGKDLGSVTEALSKAANGNFKSLKALDPALTDLIKDGADTDEVMGALAKTFGGQMAASTQTASGKMAIAKARFADLQETIGTKVIPIILTLVNIFIDDVVPTLEKVGSVLQGVGRFLSDHKELVIAAAVGITAALVPAFVAWAITAGTAAAATIAAAAPVIAIGVAIAALAAGIIYAYEHWDVFRNAVDAVADAMVWLWDHVLKPTAAWITGTLAPVIADITITFWRFLGEVRDTVSRVVDVFAGIAEAISAPFRAAFNFIADAWNNTVGKLSFEVPGWVPGLGGHGWDVPDLPHFHSGGTFRSPMPGGEGLALLRDGERVEAPGRRTTPEPRQPAWPSGDIVVNIGGREFARIAADELRRQMAGSK